MWRGRLFGIRKGLVLDIGSEPGYYRELIVMKTMFVKYIPSLMYLIIWKRNNAYLVEILLRGFT